MFLLKRISILCLLILSFGSMVYTQVLPTTPPVYVSGGATIYTVANGTITPIFTSTNAGSNFESLAIGPDNATVDVDGTGNAKYAYFLYACDPAGTIIRIAFLPAATQSTPPTVAGTETVYNGSVHGLAAPVCGRSSSAGDFYVTNKSGSGVFVFSGIASVPFGSSSPKPTPVALSPSLPNTMTGRGVTQKYVGDLFIVDNFDNQVLRAPYAVPFAAQSTFINSNLNGPVGLATAVTTTLNPVTGVFVPNSNFFVANSNSSKILATQPPVSVFTFNDAMQTVVPAAPCPALNFPNGGGPPQVADYLASAPTADPTNMVLVTNSNNAGTLWTWNTAKANCTLNFVASIGKALSGVAVGPVPVTLNLPVSATVTNPPTPTIFNFNSSLFQLTAKGPCTASVTAYPLSLATVNSMINLAKAAGGDTFASPPYPVALIPPQLLNSATPAVGLGDGGFEIGYVAHWMFPANGPPSCTTVFTDLGFKTGEALFVDNQQFTNPRDIQCDNSDASTEPQLFPPGLPSVATTCGAPEPVAVYPLGGPIALDTTRLTNSVFVGVNEGTSTAKFCGFQPTLLNPGDPGYPMSYSQSTNTVNVKFKISTLSGNCKKDFITTASALISVARLCANASSDPSCGPNGSPVFNAINVQPTASSLDTPPLFNSGNQQYSFTLNLPSIFAQAGAGTYSLTVTFLTNDTMNQTILFQLTQ